VESWKHKISSESAHIHGEVVLVAHSVGGSIVLRFLSEEKMVPFISGLFLLAAPSWDKGQWDFDDLKLPEDIAGRFSQIPRIFLYHCRDDDIVPFAHLELHEARLPRAVNRAIDVGGHQFGNDLTNVARDIHDMNNE
jgi:serine hydrolase